MLRSRAAEGFSLAYERAGDGPAVVLLHGWPGDHTDYRHVVPLLTGQAEVVVPDLRGFGESDKHPADPKAAYSADAQARSVIALIKELGLERVVLGGYDIGSRIAQAVARTRPNLVGALVLSPPLPGAGERLLTPQSLQEFWYQSLHRSPLAEQLIDGRPEAVRIYLRYFWSHWSAPGFTLPADELEHLVAHYAAPGAFTASIAWYRAGSGAVARAMQETPPPPDERVAVPLTVLWPGHDPLFKFEWADRLGEFFADVTLHHLPGSGHYTPVESPQEFAGAILRSLGKAQ
jgi:pimeloyl-ACP methyl ester carboxylesterase